MVARKCKRLRPEDGTPTVKPCTELRKESNLLSLQSPADFRKRCYRVEKWITQKTPDQAAFKEPDPECAEKPL